MTFRTRLLFAAALLAQTFYPVLVTSQVPASASAPVSSSPGPRAALPWPGSFTREEEITIKALLQEKQGTIYRLKGQASIHTSEYDLAADEITYNADTGDATAEGHVVLDGSLNDEHVEASRAEYNVRSESGRFYDVIGRAGLRVHGGRADFTSPNPFTFTGKLVEKTGADHYVVTDGTVTTCELPQPKWQFYAHRVVVDLGGNATLYHSTFRIKGIPVFYFPFATHPIAPNARQSGFTIPNVGNSNTKGYIMGESVFWAVNRSVDVTAGTDYYSLRGLAPHAQLRARPSESSFVDFNYQGMFDRGIGHPAVDQGGQNVRLNAEALFPHDFRGVARMDYLSSYIYRLAFNEVFSQPVNSEVKSIAFLSNTTNGFSYNAMGGRYQNFESTTKGDVITILHAPSFDFSSVDRQIARSPFYWSLDAAVEGLSRSEPLFTTNGLVGRFDVHPTVSVPLLFHGWSLRPALGLRETDYTEELAPSGGIGVAKDQPVTRRAFEGAVELRPPAVSRVFQIERLGRKFKHVVEPRITYRYVTGVNNFADILRFDQRDILSNTHEVEYAVVNRLYAKRVTEAEDCSQQNMPSLTIGEAPPESGMPWARPASGEPACSSGPETREVVTWELKQKYFLDDTFGGALQPGNRNVFSTTAELTGIAFLTQPRHLSPLVSTLRIETTAHTDAEWIVDYDFQLSRINGSTALLNYYVGPFSLGGADTLLRVFDQSSSPSGTPSISVPEFHQFRFMAGYGRATKPGLSAAASLGYDAKAGFLQVAAAQLGYQWDCCGLSLEYRRFALGSVRNENQYRFVFSLANLVSLGNLRRQARLF